MEMVTVLTGPAEESGTSSSLTEHCNDSTIVAAMMAMTLNRFFPMILLDNVTAEFDDTYFQLYKYTIFSGSTI